MVLRLAGAAGFASLVLLFAGSSGCKDTFVPITTPDTPVYLGSSAVVIQDTSTVAFLHTVGLRFFWQTDRPSTDVLFFGQDGDSLRDSLVAENVESTPTPGAATTHLHQAPPASQAMLQVPSGSVLFYRVRSRGTNGQSGYSDLFRYHAYGRGEPARLNARRLPQNR